MFAIRASRSKEDTYLKNNGKATFDIRLRDTKTGLCYYGKATVKENSPKVTITMRYHKLIANREYRVEFGSGMWTMR